MEKYGENDEETIGKFERLNSPKIDNYYSGENKYFRRWLLDSIAVNRIVGDSQEVAQYIALEESHIDPLPARRTRCSSRDSLFRDGCSIL